MAEPIKLVKGKEELTVCAPSYAAQLVREGWRLASDAPVAVVQAAQEPHSGTESDETPDEAEKPAPKRKSATRSRSK